MGNLGLTEILISSGCFVLFAAPILALVSAALFETEVWKRAGYHPQAKAIWIVLCIVLGPFGSLSYLIGIRPKLRRAALG